MFRLRQQRLVGKQLCKHRLHTNLESSIENGLRRSLAPTASFASNNKSSGSDQSQGRHFKYWSSASMVLGASLAASYALSSSEQPKRLAFADMHAGQRYQSEAD